MFSFSFSDVLLAIAFVSWLSCIFTDVIFGLIKYPSTDITPVLCFLIAVAASFIAGALYGREAEFEKAQREKVLDEEDVECQPLLGPEVDEKDTMECHVEHIE